MVKIYANIDYNLPDALEDYFCGLETSNWSIDKMNDATPPQIVGYFENLGEAAAAYKEVRKNFKTLPEEFSSEEIFDRDWQNEYKKYLTSWQCRSLHWVPLWERESYALPRGHKAFYFDAGLAFGTGDHPTTRLCAIRMLDFLEKAKDASKISLIDAGCGSGILAVSAKLLGVGKVYGFDKDPEAVRVSVENAKTNGVLCGIEFAEAGIDDGLKGRACDILLANIQADILQIYARELIAGVKSGGILVLSGILASENEEVKRKFLEAGAGKIKTADSAFMGEWSDILFEIA
ncbi:MAG: 50S ribosomal protein L11 methyltransferase [Opitutales bacterium]|nr:50S ribosomal protein L11 methyltransferase [Opitutales bacterium]